METELAPGLRAVANACQQGKIDAATFRDIRDSVEKATRSIEVLTFDEVLSRNSSKYCHVLQSPTTHF